MDCKGKTSCRRTMKRNRRAFAVDAPSRIPGILTGQVEWAGEKDEESPTQAQMPKWHFMRQAVGILLAAWFDRKKSSVRLPFAAGAGEREDRI